MEDQPIAPALAAYFEGYNTSDRDLLSSAFAEDATLAVNHLPPAAGRDAVVGMHVRMGVYHYRVRRVIQSSDDLQVIEGAIYAVRDGQDVEDVPVHFAAVGDLVEGGRKLRFLRLYYDFGRMGEASKAAAPAS